MTHETLYADRLVTIGNHGITFRLYYFPVGSKTVSFAEIEWIRTAKPSLATGKWRMWGSGDLVTWFPCDIKRFLRDTVFFLKLKDKPKFIGFTVERPLEVITVLQTKGVFDHTPWEAPYGGEPHIRRKAIRRLLIAVGLAVILPIALIWTIPFVWTSLYEKPTVFSETPDGQSPQYHDSLVTISSSGIVFSWYDFPLGTSKQVSFSEIEFIRALKPSSACGKWRLWGGNSRIWFPCDNRRPFRDTIFILKLNGQDQWIGFTVEDSIAVIDILRAKGLLQ